MMRFASCVLLGGRFPPRIRAKDVLEYLLRDVAFQKMPAIVGGRARHPV
jgi:hypothetical protein